MPIFDLFCQKCGREDKDVTVATSKAAKDIRCPSCGYIMYKRPPVFNPIFKGGGWTPKFNA